MNDCAPFLGISHLLGFIVVCVGSVTGDAVAKTEVGAEETLDDGGATFNGSDGEGDITVDAGPADVNLLGAEAIVDTATLLCPHKAASVNVGRNY